MNHHNIPTIERPEITTARIANQINETIINTGLHPKTITYEYLRGNNKLSTCEQLNEQDCTTLAKLLISHKVNKVHIALEIPNTGGKTKVITFAYNNLDLVINKE